MAGINVQLVTPEREVLRETVDRLSCPTSEGQITILPHHAPLVATLVSGELIAHDEHGEHNIHVAGGFVEVKPNNEVVILADAAEHFYEIDIARAEEAKQQAEATLREENRSKEEHALASILLQRNLTRIRIARKHAHRRAPITSEGVFHD
jgi:F-type H+-transporting ATPase subunit epsilon